MGTPYETDIVAWANEQAAFLRAGDFTALDLMHIAEEIEDVGKSERRELESRLAVLLAHLLKWKLQPIRRTRSWRMTIRTQRKSLKKLLDRAQSLRNTFEDEVTLDEIWSAACDIAERETGLDIDYPDQWIWSVEEVLDQAFLPD